jgi:uncharacterized protein YbbC (DUF1343 family)
MIQIMRSPALIALLFFMCFCKHPSSQTSIVSDSAQNMIFTGAEQTGLYFPLLKGKAIACVANQTSVIGKVHLVDSLVGAGFHLTKVFSPEHGFRGQAGAGEEVANQVDIKTGLPVVSLYGAKKKPTAEDLAGVEVVVFDIQDVGARFYTYISTMTFVMEACAEKGVPFILLDRPNPNGDYVDGPVLEKGFESFVGLHPVPIVYGMTIGEYARMVNGEKWLANGVQANLTVVPLKGYDHSSRYSLPVKPSPNLPNDEAICLYPSLCLFEGTIVSVGRGTEYPFQVIGHPYFVIGSYIFKPESRPGAEHPPYEGRECFGGSLSSFAQEVCQKERRLHLSFLIHHYDFFKISMKNLNQKEVPSSFFNDYFDKLAGNSSLRQQIIQGTPEEEIRASWQPALTRFKAIRQKYLLYMQ